MFGLVILNQISLQNSGVGCINVSILEVSGSVNLGKELMDGHTWLRDSFKITQNTTNHKLISQK